MWKPTMSSDELYHHGILGMHWGVRRYQNPDGSLTTAGRRRLNMGEKKKGLSDEQKAKMKKVAIGAAVIGGTALAAYGAYKIAGPEIATMAKAAMNKESIPQHVLKMSTRDLLKTGNLSEKAFNKGRISKANPKKLNITPKLHETIAREANRRLDFNDKLKNYSELTKKIGPSTPYEAKQLAKTASKARSSINSETFAKQLSSNGKVKTGSVKDFNTVFGTNTSKSTGSNNSDLARLLANSQRLSNLASQSYSTATKSTGVSDYTKELLKKNKSKLSSMTMKDLKDLDLY